MNKLLYILIALCTLSCTTERKAIKYFDNHELTAAKYCADRYPIKERIIKGDSIVITKIDTIPGVEIPCPPNEKGEVVFVKCPESKTHYRTVSRTDTIVKENTAKIKELEILLIKEKDKSEKAEKKAKKYLNRFLVISIIFGIAIYLRIKRIL